MPEQNLKSIILAAGMGSRLYPFTADRPKCLVEIDGHSLLDYQLQILKAAHISDIYLVAGYKHEKLSSHHVNLIINEQYETTNMVSSLFCAEKELEGNVLISYGDIVYSKQILDSIIDSTADIAVVIDKNWEAYWRERFADPLDDAETLSISNEGLIMNIGDKADSVDEIDGQYIGLIKLSVKGSKQIKAVYSRLLRQNECLGKPLQQAYMTELLQATINQGYPVTAVPVYDKWIEIDSVSDLQSECSLRRLSAIRAEY